MTKELELTIDEIADIKSMHSCKLNPESPTDKYYIDNPVLKEVIENYTLITNPGLTGKYLDTYHDTLKLDILEYFDEKEPEYSLSNLRSIAYFRLDKAANQYSLEKSYGSDAKKLTEIGKKAKAFKKEYDIISYLE